MRVLVLQHHACERPGVYEDVLRERQAQIVVARLDEGEPVPRGAWDAIVAMGGPMSATDDDALPWLLAEKRFIAEQVRAGTPFWGACLGVQLLAAALDAKVYPGPQPEVGILPVELTEAAAGDPVFGGLPPTLLTLQWHGDTFDLPEGAVLLARSPAYESQAFRYGRAAYGVQFHVEVNEEIARGWTAEPSYREYLDDVLGPGAFDDLMARLAETSDEVVGNGRRLFERWLDAVVPAAVY